MTQHHILGLDPGFAASSWPKSPTRACKPLTYPRWWASATPTSACSPWRAGQAPQRSHAPRGILERRPLPGRPSRGPLRPPGLQSASACQRLMPDTSTLHHSLHPSMCKRRARRGCVSEWERKGRYFHSQITQIFYLIFLSRGDQSLPFGCGRGGPGRQHRKNHCLHCGIATVWGMRGAVHLQIISSTRAAP